MKPKSFGIVNQSTLVDELDQYIEELTINGFSVIENLLSEEELVIARKKLDDVYAKQVNEFSEKELDSIQELNLARMPFAYDEYFLKIATNEKLVHVIQKFLGNYFVLHLQNGIINMPKQGHHQHSWHRDLPYQDFVISRPLAISCLFCLDNFDASTGGTIVLPHTHKVDQMPSQQYIDKFATQITAKAGSVILFDSMVFHKAGYNTSDQIRRGLNHMYTSAILKQQINIPASLNGKYSDDSFLKMLLGYEACPPTSVFEWRNQRINKK
jgi:ectoine hydroxylase-related dioxygenase (phytanoyl-CoA dioxygenase family)